MYSDNPVTASLHICACCTYSWWCRRQDDPNDSPTRELEETIRASPYHVAEHCSARSESPQPLAEQSCQPGSEPSSVEADFYVWHYALLVVHASKEEEEEEFTVVHSWHAPCLVVKSSSLFCNLSRGFLWCTYRSYTLDFVIHAFVTWSFWSVILVFLVFYTSTKS